MSAVASPPAKPAISTEPKTAIPIVAPIWRKNCTDDVPTPSSRCGSAFCTIIECMGMAAPTPTPSSSM